MTSKMPESGVWHWELPNTIGLFWEYQIHFLYPSNKPVLMLLEERQSVEVDQQCVAISLGCFMMEIIAHYCRATYRNLYEGNWIFSCQRNSLPPPPPQNRKKDYLYSYHTIRFVQMSACCHYSWKRSVVYWSSDLLDNISPFHDTCDGTRCMPGFVPQ